MSIVIVICYLQEGDKSFVSVQNWSFLVANFETLQKDSCTWNMFSSFFQCVSEWVCVFLRAPYPFTIVTVNWWWWFYFYFGKWRFDRLWSRVSVVRRDCFLLFFLQLDRFNCSFFVSLSKCDDLLRILHIILCSSIYRDDFSMVMNSTLHSSWQHWFVCFSFVFCECSPVLAARAFLYALFASLSFTACVRLLWWKREWEDKKCVLAARALFLSLSFTARRSLTLMKEREGKKSVARVLT